MEQERELVRIGGRRGTAALSVLCGALEEGTAMKIACGDLVVFTVTRSEASLGMVVCSLQDHRWILALDCAVIRVGPRKFAFAFPQFFYCLSLPDGCFDHEVDRLEMALQRFTCYRNHAGLRDTDFAPRIPGKTDFWVSAYSKIISLSSQLVSQPVPHCSLSEALHVARKYHTCTNIALHILKNIAHPLRYIAVPVPTTSPLSSLVFPSINVIADVAKVLQGSRFSHVRRRGRSACWYVSEEGLARILQGVIAWKGREIGGCSEERA